MSWKSAGIRTKILVPLVILMLLSLLGSTLGFIISTERTRTRILTEQLEEDAERVIGAFKQTKRDAVESARRLAQDDTVFRQSLIAERDNPNENRSLEMVDRAVPVRERFGLDQVIVLDATGQARVNIAREHLESIYTRAPELLRSCSGIEQVLVPHDASFGRSFLLVVCAPIQTTPADEEATGSSEQLLLGYVYTIIDLEEWVQRTGNELELVADLELKQVENGADPNAAASSAPYQVQELPKELPLSDVNDMGQVGPLQLLLLLRTDTIDEILESGQLVTFISSMLTLVLVLAVGAWLAQSFSRPILRLAAVAQDVAAGNLERRANLTHEDEIGQLGRTFDYATERIADLLDEQARTAGERQAILNGIADGVVAVDPNERIVMVNPMAERLLEQDADALIGQPIGVLASSNDPTVLIGLQQIVHQLRSELNNHNTVPREEQVSLGNRIVRIHSTPTCGSGGVATGAVVVLQDVTSSVEADRAKSAFIATASHEMRTPLTSLKGFVDVFYLSGVDNLTESQQMFLDTIRRQTDNIVIMVNDLLEMARLEQGAQRVERHWVQPTGVIDEALGSLKALIEQREVTIQRDLAPNLPAVWIDHLHLRRMLVNLISNAVKYVYRGGNVQIQGYFIDDPARLPHRPECTTNISSQTPWTHSSEESLVLAVEDNGVGIRTEDQPRIFSRFFRSENPLSVEVGGSGLGLAITQSLVAIHGGQLGFWSLENQGSCFWVRLPVSALELMDVDEHKVPDQTSSTPSTVR